MALVSPDERIDWFRVILDVERNGYSHCSIAVAVGVGKRTVGGWKQGATPRWDDGERLMDLWESVTGNGRESAHKVKRYSHLA